MSWCLKRREARSNVTVRSPCHAEVTSRASSRSFEWVSIAYPGVVRFDVRRASRVEKTQEVKASTYRGSKTKGIGLSSSSRALRSPEGGSRRKETRTSEFHRRTSLRARSMVRLGLYTHGGTTTARRERRDMRSTRDR